LIHADSFSFRATERAPHTPSTGKEDESASVSDCLVVFTAVEKGDAENAGETVDNAKAEIIKLCDELKAERVVLYPYTHLSSNLSTPLQAIEVLKKLKEALSSVDVTAAPFGWYKAFDIKCKGHPRSESLREITPYNVAKERVKKSPGKAHPVASLNQRFREIFLNLGFDETINPSIIQDQEIYKQYGPEAPLILDRVFYLAGLPRPDIGISQLAVEQIRELVPGFDKKEILEQLFRDYKKGEIESDDFVEEMVKRTGINEVTAIRIIDDVFPGLKDLTPEPSNRTLRSHMTSLWFPLLENVQKHRPVPLRLFSIGPRFRKEQREDASHLYESTSASIVVMDDNFTLEDGKKITADILKGLGIDDCEFRLKEVTSNYYEYGTDTEVFVTIGGREMEIANIGFYSSDSLANYNIRHRVFNLGFGVERIAMAYEKSDDMRAFVYPLLFEPEMPTDEEIAENIGPEKEPSSAEGRAIAEKLIKTAMGNKDKAGPSEILAYEGSLKGTGIKVYVYNWDEGKPLLSFAALNSVVVHDCSIYGLPVDHPKLPAKFKEIVEKGVKTDLIFLDLIMTGVAAEIETAVEENRKEYDKKIRIIKHPSHTNLDIPAFIYNAITAHHKNIAVSGPIFAGVRAEIMNK
jgi:O-phosphoseryl-tRNA synthetase